ncbi:MAG: DUF1513 domain-containing protein [Burkholderiales bacterium]|nr:DUF1513 domain-containing protein [Burkholderiales bacterium]
MDIGRRNALRGLSAGLLAGLLPPGARASPQGGGPRFASAWMQGDEFRAGILLLDRAGGRLRDGGSIAVPTRAHGLACDAAGRFLAVARRPGDWLLRWRGAGHDPHWHWIEPSRAFNGHVLADPDGRRIYTTETDLETGAGLIGVRDAATLEKTGEWPTQGRDPHALAVDPAAPGRLFVANGGILTLPETGRAKHHLDRMDSSLACIDTRNGALTGQWRLADPRLSLRHLAWSADRAVLAVALQAEHDAPEARANAPLLALFDGRRLAVAGALRPLGGYGGDVAACAGGFAVSCTRAHGVARYGGDGRWRGFVPLPEAGALAEDAGILWAGGRMRAAALGGDGPPRRTVLSGPRRDNHRLVLRGPGAAGGI